MSRTTVEAWKCDVCGFEWLVRGDKEPECCASQKCRSRKWNARAKFEKVMGPPIETAVDTAKLGVAILERERRDLEVGGRAKWHPDPRLAKLNEAKYGKGKK